MPALRSQVTMHDADQTLIGRLCPKGGSGCGGRSNAYV
jgi:hypothetical protein